VPGRFASTPLQQNPALERAIAEQPYEEEPWIVLEDWLLECGDPRGVLVLLEKAGRRDGALRARRRLYPQLLGADHEALAPLLFAANWRAGYGRECHYAAHTAKELRALARAPAARILRALTLTTVRTQCTEALTHLREATFAGNLHALTISSAHGDSPIVDPSRLAPFPRLRHLALRGVYLSEGSVPHITSLLVAPTRFDHAQLPALLSTIGCPNLTSLVIDLANLSACGPEVVRTLLSAATLAPVMTKTFAPNLTHLELRDATLDHAADVLEIVAASELQAQLATLDLGTLEISPALLIRYGDFARLRVRLPPR
jgi:uncharacterized protein (TIGR02996 family)